MAGQIFQLIPPIIALIMVALGMDVTVADFAKNNNIAVQRWLVWARLFFPMT